MSFAGELACARVRRIVTGHDAEGRAVIAEDAQLTGAGLAKDTEPGTRSPMHRTESLDYGICLEGEVDLELDGGDAVTVRAGDVVVQRGTNHVWHNRSDAPCRVAWILLDAEPMTVGDRRQGISWRHHHDLT